MEVALSFVGLILLFVEMLTWSHHIPNPVQCGVDFKEVEGRSQMTVPSAIPAKF